jgi:hypothetical protein
VIGFPFQEPRPMGGADRSSEVGTLMRGISTCPDCDTLPEALPQSKCRSATCAEQVM